MDRVVYPLLLAGFIVGYIFVALLLLVPLWLIFLGRWLWVKVRGDRDG